MLHLVHCGVEAERCLLAAAPHLVRVRVRVRFVFGFGFGFGFDLAAAAHLVEARAIGRGDKVDDCAVVVDGPPLLRRQLVQCTWLGSESGL